MCGQDLACERLIPDVLSNCHSKDFPLPRFGSLEGSGRVPGGLPGEGNTTCDIKIG